LRVLLVAGSYPPMRCGVGDYTGRLVLALRKEALDVSVLTSVQAMGAVSTWRAGVAETFASAAGRFAPEIVHIQFPTQGYDSVDGLVEIALHARRRLRLPLVVTFHEFLAPPVTRQHLGILALARHANAIIAVRPQFRARLSWLARLALRGREVRQIGSASAIPASAQSEAERQAVRRGFGRGEAKLVAFFGFSYPHKGVDLLFRIADPAQHHLVVIGELMPDDAYHGQLRALAASDGWDGKVTFTGFVEPARAAELLAAADAAVFPYRNGGGDWNSSLHAALSQDTFVLTTSHERSGYDPRSNVYYARPGAVDEMRGALLRHQGTRRRRQHEGDAGWRAIALQHQAVYASLLQRRAAA
jgi:glycosyltransferase involved in cell wall biosynthesis